MTNPNDAVGTNAAYGGRTSANAFNDDLAMYSAGVVSGWACAPDSGMTISLGGNGTVRDVAIAEDNAGNKTTINNISGSPINVTLDPAPASNSRIDLVVAYVDNPPQGDNSTADNPGACGIIPVTGTAGATPIAPNDSAIRTAITGDGASGTTAYYVVLAQITVINGTTDIVAGDIVAGAEALITTKNIDFTFETGTITYPNVHAIENTSHPLTVSKFGKMVFLSGSIQLTGYSSADATLASDITDAAKLPAGFEPADRQMFYAQSGGNVPVRVIVKSDGYIDLGRYKPYKSYTGFATIDQNTAVNFTCAYVGN